jgi:cytochrome c oxidase subunit 2
LAAFVSGWLLAPSGSSFGPSIDRLYYLVLWITGVVFVLVQGALVAFCWRYRRKNNRAEHYSHGNTAAELLWSAIPAAILAALGFFAQDLWSALRSLPEKPAVTVRVQAEQWLWHFQYAGLDGRFDTPDDVTVDNEAHVPAGEPVVFELKALDVIHGFYVPALRIHNDAMPGLTAKVWVRAQPGRYDLRCTQFCGTNHYQMRGLITAEPAEAFKAWLQSAKAESF